MAIKRVTLLYPPSSTQTSLQLSIENPEVQDAAKLIDEIVTSFGLEKTSSASDTNLVAHYYCRRDPKRAGIRCRVYFRDNKLDILLSEFGRFSSSKTVKIIADSLDSKLIERYGSQRVRIGKADSQP